MIRTRLTNLKNNTSFSFFTRSPPLVPAFVSSFLHCIRQFSHAPPTTATTPLASAHRLDKVHHFVADAFTAAGLDDGATLLVGGFGLCGIPNALVKEIQRRGTRQLTVISNNCGADAIGLGLLLQQKQIRKLICSYMGDHHELEKQYKTGDIEVELVPQGSLIEKIRAGGAGIGGFYTPTGAGTLISDGGFATKRDANGRAEKVAPPKEIRRIGGRDYVFEEPLKGDIALIKAWRSDAFGNLQYRHAAQNFNPDCAMAARFTIAEVEEIVQTGSIEPTHVHTPGIFVHAVVLAKEPKPIERLTLAEPAAAPSTPQSAGPLSVRERIARRAAQELRSGMTVNLGIGIPTHVLSHMPSDTHCMFHSENGIIGMGRYPKAGQEDADLINAGKETITLESGASICSSSTSFAMVRGGHIDVSILGAMQVSQHGDLANWAAGHIKGMGGAMDLVAGGSRIVIAMEHNTASGGMKIVPSCSLPLTGSKVVARIITDKCVMDVDPVSGLTMVELAHDVTVEQVRKLTGAQFQVSPNVRTMT